MDASACQKALLQGVPAPAGTGIKLEHVISGGVYLGNDTSHARSVSYTHLDVYKRQALRTSQHVLKEVIADECYLLEEMANGNFDVHSKNVDMYVGVLQSVLKSVRVINGNLSDTLSQIGVSAEQVSAGSEQVSNGAQALAQGATEQASAVQELSLIHI